jgi:His-Xaa-Ser system radical SAM maturase HxsC
MMRRAARFYSAGFDRMLLKLSTRDLQPLSETSSVSFIGRISQNPECSSISATHEIFLAAAAVESLPTGFRAYLVRDPAISAAQVDSFALAPELGYLAHGDVVRIDPKRRALTALYRRNSPSNFFLVTERCDNYCLMCSQPPKAADDSWLVDELRQVIPLVSQETPELGITGGEPGLLRERLVELIGSMKSYLPRTAVHVLSNGRQFADASFASSLGKLGHPDLMIGIPLYSDLPEEHDFIVQARGAFDETIRGILNLKRSGVRVEIRFVVHEETYRRLPEFAEFVTRNLLFVDHVAIMGLEPTGFAKANIEALWVDPLDYQNQLRGAVLALRRSRLKVSIYNHQLCVLDQSLHRFARKSISDWKSRYFEECEGCSQQTSCGGFFASATLRRSRGIAAVS